MATRDARETSAERWASWRRAATVSVTPADTRLYRVVTDDAERIIGLGTTQLALIGARSSARQLWMSVASRAHPPASASWQSQASRKPPVP